MNGKSTNATNVDNSKKSPLAIFCAVIPIEGKFELTPPIAEVPVKKESVNVTAFAPAPKQ